MKYLVACLMAFGFYGLTFGQMDTTSRAQDTTGMIEEPTLTCYMVDETTFLCTTEENIEGMEEETVPETEEGVIQEEGEQDDVLKEDDILHEEGQDIEGREEEFPVEPETRDEQVPMEPERESDEGIMPENESGKGSDWENQNSDQSKESEENLNTY